MATPVHAPAALAITSPPSDEEEWHDMEEPANTPPPPKRPPSRGKLQLSRGKALATKAVPRDKWEADGWGEPDDGKFSADVSCV